MGTLLRLLVCSLSLILFPDVAIDVSGESAAWRCSSFVQGMINLVVTRLVALFKYGEGEKRIRFGCDALGDAFELAIVIQVMDRDGSCLFERGGLLF